MRNALTALLSAASLFAVAGVAPASAQTYGTPWPYPLQSTYAGPYATAPSHTGTPAYSWHRDGPYPAVVGSCDIISGNRVCSAAPAGGYANGYGYGYGPGGPIGAAVAAPFEVAGAIVSAPVAVVGAAPAPWSYGPGAPYAGAYPTVPAATGAPPYSYRTASETPQPGINGSCQILAGNRVCTSGYVP